MTTFILPMPKRLELLKQDKLVPMDTSVKESSVMLTLLNITLNQSTVTGLLEPLIISILTMQQKLALSKMEKQVNTDMSAKELLSTFLLITTTD